MTERVRKVLEDAMHLSVEERADLTAELLDSLPADELHPDWEAEIERRARRAWQDPGGGELWEAVEKRLLSRVAR